MEMHKKRPLSVERETIRVVIFIHHYKIIGDMYMPAGGRLSDYLNKTLGGENPEVFIPITNAECFSISDGQLKYVTGFVAVNKNHVQLIFPYKGK